MEWIVIHQLLGKTLEVSILCPTFFEEPEKHLTTRPPVSPHGTEHPSLSHLGRHPTSSAVNAFHRIILGSHPDSCVEINDLQAEVIGVDEISRLDIQMSYSVLVKVCQPLD
jgi:hypothetical protein